MDISGLTGVFAHETADHLIDWSSGRKVDDEKINGHDSDQRGNDEQ